MTLEEFMARAADAAHLGDASALRGYAQQIFAERDEVERLRRVVNEVRRLVNSGYAGPFEGAAIEPLLAAVREYERSCRDQS